MKKMKYCQLRTDFNRWGIIGGALEYNETLEDALKRECLKKLDLLLKIQNYSVHTQGQISFKSIQVAIKYTVYSLFIFAENFGELVCNQSESKELRFFSLNELPNNLPPVIEKIITDYLKNKGTLNVPSQINPF